MTERAICSVWQQTILPIQLSVAIDARREGAARTRQRALDAACTEWVAFLDSDDQFMAHHLETLYAHALDNNADYVFSWFLVCGGVDPFPPGHRLDPWDNAVPRQTTMTVLVRTDLAKEVGFDQPIEGETIDGMRAGEDFRFTLGCMSRGAKISRTSERTWVWHHHGGNTSGMPGYGDARLAGG
jgi:glycosyltransferase involved in cell wall biosynthesis